MSKQGFKRVNRIGQRFGRLEIISYPNLKKKNERKKAKCKCDCGNYLIVEESSLVSGGTKSCGCLKTESNLSRGDGHTKDKLYRVYYAIKGRCNNLKDKGYKNYGARGIKVCSEWLDSYYTFKEWALKNGYKEGLEIDRINNDGNYEPNNCRFVSKAQNTINRRVAVLITYQGETKTLSEWAAVFEIPVRRLRSRYCEQGMSFEKSVSKKLLYR